MDISVTVPVYNVEKYLERCLNSIIGQSFTGEFEIICVDDGSTDKSGEILDEFAKRYPDKIKAIHQHNQGLSGARNTALKYITGKYTMFVDSDDFIHKNALEDLYNYAESHNADVILFDHIFKVEGQKGTMQHHFKNIAEKYGDKPFNIDSEDPIVYQYAPVATWSKFYLTDIIKDLKFEYDMYYEDRPHWDLVYTRAKRVYYYPKPFYFYTLYRKDAITSAMGVKTFDIFRAFSISEKILRETGYFEKLKYIHYGHFAYNLCNRLRKLKPELREEYIETIKKYNIDMDYNEFVKTNVHQSDKEMMKLVKYIREHSFEDTDTMLKKNGFWN